jgi:hypothetical protein
VIKGVDEQEQLQFPEPEFPEPALQGFLACPVAGVAPVVARRVMLLVAQVIGHLGLQGSL